MSVTSPIKARAWWGRGLGLAALAAVACGPEGGSQATEGVPPPPPPTTTGTTDVATTTGEGTTTGIGSECPCPAGQFCVAEVDVGSGVEPPPAEAFVCRDACIPTGSANLWCFDAQSCCDPAATCEAGFCRIPVETTGTTGATSSTDGVETTSSTGTGTDASTGSTGDGTGTTGVSTTSTGGTTGTTGTTN